MCGNAPAGYSSVESEKCIGKIVFSGEKVKGPSKSSRHGRPIQTDSPKRLKPLERFNQPN